MRFFCLPLLESVDNQTANTTELVAKHTVTPREAHPTIYTGTKKRKSQCSRSMLTAFINRSLLLCFVRIDRQSVNTTEFVAKYTTPPTGRTYHLVARRHKRNTTANRRCSFVDIPTKITPLSLLLFSSGGKNTAETRTQLHHHLPPAGLTHPHIHRNKKKKATGAFHRHSTYFIDRALWPCSCQNRSKSVRIGGQPV